MKKHLVNFLKFAWENVSTITCMLIVLSWLVDRESFYKIHTNDMIICSIIMIFGLTQESIKKMYKKLK